MVFGRGKKESVDPVVPESSDLKGAGVVDGSLDVGDGDLDEPESDEPGSDTPDVVRLVSPVLAPEQRPWDSEETPTDEMPRLDLGGLQVPVLPETEIRVELNEQKQPIAVTILHAESAVQLLVFAAPRRDGIWDEVRGEIVDSVRADGGQVEEILGDFGIELRASMRGEVTPGQFVEQQLRFVGFDGPRWFVRGVYSGPAAAGEQSAVLLDSVLADLIVVRGEEPMAPRDPLPLRLPREAVAAQEAAEAQAAEANQAPTLDPLTRGPEITETR